MFAEIKVDKTGTYAIHGTVGMEFQGILWGRTPLFNKLGSKKPEVRENIRWCSNWPNALRFSEYQA